MTKESKQTERTPRSGAELNSLRNWMFLCFVIAMGWWYIRARERNHTERTLHSGAEYNSLSNWKFPYCIIEIDWKVYTPLLCWIWGFWFIRPSWSIWSACLRPWLRIWWRSKAVWGRGRPFGVGLAGRQLAWASCQRWVSTCVTQLACLPCEWRGVDPQHIK